MIEGLRQVAQVSPFVAIGSAGFTEWAKERLRKWNGYDTPDWNPQRYEFWVRLVSFLTSVVLLVGMVRPNVATIQENWIDALLTWAVYVGIAFGLSYAGDGLHRIWDLIEAIAIWLLYRVRTEE